MNMNWVWPAWIIVLIISFAVLEGYALVHNQPTLSEWVWNTTKAWPPLGVIYGMIVGGLGVHFFWPDQGPIAYAARLIVGR